MAVPLPDNEDERLAALNRLSILDTNPDDAFDRVTSLAQNIFGVSSAAVSLVDEDRQWFKSMCGWGGAKEMSRDISFCTHAILDEGVMVVEDTTKDQRFSSNPLVLGEEDVQFYAGAPLKLEGDIRIGTLCLLDDYPHAFGREAQEQLASLAEVVVDLLEARKMTHEVGYLRSALEAADDPIVITEANPLDPPGPRIVWVNQAFSRMTGYERDEVIGKTPRILQGPDTDTVVLNKVRSALKTGRAVHAETVNYRKDGTPYVVAWRIAPVRSEEGKLTHWMSIQRDVTDRQRREERLKQRATRDSLTGLRNRYALEKEVRKAMEDSGGTKRRGLLYLDLDKFKPVNDDLGHSAGDRVLVRTAEVLENTVRKEDIVGRIGGDEFVVLLSGFSDTETIYSTAGRLSETLAEPMEIDSEEVEVPASIGGILGLSRYESAEEALHAADLAMYEAKESSRPVVIWEASDQLEERMDL